MAGQFESTILGNLCKVSVQRYEKKGAMGSERLKSSARSHLRDEGWYEEYDQDREVAVCVGPEHGTVDSQLVSQAAKEAVQAIGFGLLIASGMEPAGASRTLHLPEVPPHELLCARFPRQPFLMEGPGHFRASILPWRWRPPQASHVRHKFRGDSRG